MAYLSKMVIMLVQPLCSMFLSQACFKMIFSYSISIKPLVSFFAQFELNPAKG
jgi:hypothetical protein